MPSHKNTVKTCKKCQKILDTYPGLHSAIREWFIELQKKYPEIHVSEAGRGKERQEKLKKEGKSRASYGQSAHNYNAAIDVWFLVDKVYNLDHEHFERVVRPNLPMNLKWYGDGRTDFYERPHIELLSWRHQRDIGELKLVEPPDD
jgi:hypothetical protein